MPPPHGSASTSSAFGAPTCASAVANTDAPAPPRPAMTATTAPRAPPSRRLLRGVGELGHQIAVLRGQRHAHVARRRRSRPASRRVRGRRGTPGCTRSRRGMPRCGAAAGAGGVEQTPPPRSSTPCGRTGRTRAHDPHARGGGDAVDVGAQRRSRRSRRRMPAAACHGPSRRPSDDDATKGAAAICGSNSDLWTEPATRDVTSKTAIPQPLARLRRADPVYENDPRKGTTPARGGGGGGRRVSAPGGRADAHPA